jgi:hypothetical protein
VDLANTLLDKATLLSPEDDAEELKRLFGRVVELDRAAVAAAPDEPGYQAELALGLEDQGMFLLALGQRGRAEGLVREALAVRQRVLESGRMKGGIERYVPGDVDAPAAGG